MIASYNNAGHKARYACVSMHTSYDEPFCQTLKAEPVDTQVARLILKALEPAAIETSLAAVADLESERAAVIVIGASGWNGRNIRSTRPAAGTPASSPKTGWWPAAWSRSGRRP